MSGTIDIPKNTREVLRVERTEYQGHDLVNIRVFYDAGEGEMRPTKKGLAVQASLVPELMDALAAVSASDRRAA